MRQTLFILIIIGISQISFAQGFVKVDKYPFKPRIRNHDVRYISDDKMVVLSTFIDSMNIYQMQIETMDTFGNVINQYRIVADHGNDFIIRDINAIECDDQSCYFYVNMFTGRKCALLKFDKSFKHLTTVEHNWPPELLTKLSGTYFKNSTNQAICSAAQRSNGMDDFLFELIDDEYKVISQKYYGRENFSEYLSGAIAMPNKEQLLIGIQVPPPLPSIPYRSWYYLVRIDSMGNVLQEIKGKGTHDSNPSNGVYYRDESGEARIAFGCARREINEWGDDYDYINRFLIIDSIGNVVSETEFGQHPNMNNIITKIRKVDDGFIVAARMRAEDIDEQNIEIVICKIDHSGKIVWEEHFPLAYGIYGSSWGHFITGLDIMPSGSILATGYAQSYALNSYASFLIKLDKDGCIESGCRNVDVIEEEIQKNWTIYPNPVQDIISLENKDDFVKYEIFNLSGQILMVGKSENIDVSSLPIGLYLMKIYSEKGSEVYRFIKE